MNVGQAGRGWKAKKFGGYDIVGGGVVMGREGLSGGGRETAKNVGELSDEAGAEKSKRVSGVKHGMLDEV